MKPYGPFRELRDSDFQKPQSNPKNWTLVELMRGTPSWTRVHREAKRKPRTSRMTVNDLVVLAVAGATVLKTNKELKGDNRRALRTAVNRANRHLESI